LVPNSFELRTTLVAQKIIELAKAGERDPERLCESVLQQWVVPSHTSRRPLFPMSNLSSG